MPIGYLVSVVIVAWCGACAAGPRRWILAAGSVSFFGGFVVNELPFAGLYWLIAATVLAFGQGDLRSIVGRLALGLAFLTTAGLAVIAWRATGTGSVVDRALDEGLGDGWRNAAGAAASIRPGFAVAPVLFLPKRARRGDVERIADIPYGAAGRSNLLDVYRGRSRGGGRPVLVHLHGGRLRSGAKNRQGLPLIYALANAGWVCVSANYRLSPAATFPDHLIDVKKVLAWVRAHGEGYGADPTVLLVAGGSSGAHLAALAALTANDPLYQPGFENANTAVTAAVCLYGLYGPRSAQGLDRNDSPEYPISHIREDAPPFFVSHGDRDSLLAVDGARDFVRSLRAVSRRPVVYAELPGAQHSFDTFHSLRCDNVINAVRSFAAWVRS